MAFRFFFCLAFLLFSWPSFHHPLSCTAKEFRLRHHFERSFPDAPPTRAPRDLRNKSRAPLVRLTSNFTAIHSTIPLAERRKNFASGTILSGVFPTPRPLAHPETCAAKLAHPLPSFHHPLSCTAKEFRLKHHFERSFPNAPPTRAPRDLRNKSRAPLVRLTSNFTAIHSTIPLAERRKNFASGTILSGVFPTPRPLAHPETCAAKLAHPLHHFERSFPDAPPTRAPRDLRNKSRAPLGRLTSNFTGHYPPPPKLNGERISSLPPFQAVHSRRPAHSRTPRLAQQNSRTPCPIDFKFYRPSFHHPLSCTAKEFRLRHHFERSFPNAPPTRAPRDLRNKSRAPLVRLTSNFTAIHSTIPLAERRKNFASGTILSGVFPTPRPLAHPETCAAKLAHPLHHFERSFPDAPPTRAPRDLRNKSRAPLVRLTSNFTAIHSTIPLAERRKNFASGTILSGVFPTPRPLAHPETCAAKLAHPLHHFERSFPDAPPTRAPRDLRNKSRAPLGRLTSNFTGHYPPPPKLNGERISSLPPFQAVHSRRPAHSRTPRLAQQNSRTPCPIDFKFYRPSFHHPLSCTAKEFRLRHHFERSFPNAPPTRAPRDLRNKSRAPLVRLTSNFTAIHSTIPLAERRKNFASGTILSGVFPTPRPLAHPETCAAKLAHPLHHFERSFPDAPPTRAPRDLRNKSRAPLVRLTSNFTAIHSTIPLAERRKNFASGTILSGVFPTPRPLAHPETCATNLAHPLGRLTSNFTGHYPPPPKLNGERISSLPPFQAVHSRRPAHSRTPRLAQQNSRTPLPSFHHPLSCTAKEFRLRHHFERSFPDAPPTRAPRDLRNKSRAPLVRLTSNFTAIHSTIPLAERRKNFASGTILSGVFPTPRPLAHPETCATNLAHPLHHFERSFPDAPPTRAPRDLRNKSRAPLGRLTSNFTGHYPPPPKLNGERISSLPPFQAVHSRRPAHSRTPRLAQQNSRTPCPIDFKFYRPSFHHPLSCTAKEFRLRHHFERSFPNAPPTRAPRDLRNKSRAPLVRLTSNFTAIHSTIPLAERRKNFASGTILSGVFPTPRPLAHPETCAAKLAHPLHHFERSFPDAPPTRAPRDLRNKSRAPLGRLTSNFTGHYPPPPKLNGERISSLPPFQAVHSRRPAHSRTPRLAQQNSRTPCPIDFKFYRHHFERSFPDAPPHRAPPRIAQQNSRTRCPRQYRERGPWKRGGPRRPDDGPRQWREGVRGREGVRVDGRRNGGEESAAVERGGPWKRGRPPDGRRNGGEGSVEERGSAPPGRRPAARGPRLLTLNITAPPTASVADWLTRRANHTLGFNPARRNSRAFHPNNTKSRATPIPHPQIPTPHRPAHQPRSRTHFPDASPTPPPSHHTTTQ
ncbi:hypothetical protein niasHT_037572 [Heterodera trifolii]|uniref:Uncharacterized protein n=1 Tax=Heterodera trifolii TaxID=157864 RepID=A0ABD2I3A7_9BILA